MGLQIEAPRQINQHLSPQQYGALVYSALENVHNASKIGVISFDNALPVLMLPHINDGSFLAAYAPPEKPLWIREQAKSFLAIEAQYSRACKIEKAYSSLLERTNYGDQWHALSNYEAGGHGPSHVRRVTKSIQAILTHTPELTSQEYKLDNLKNVSRVAKIAYHIAAFFPSLHDSNQAESELLNYERNTNYEPKLGHGLAGAVQVLATEGLLQKVTEGQEDPKVVHQMAAGLAIAIAIHEWPEDLERALTGEVDAQYIDDMQLIDHWHAAEKENRINLFTLSPHQLLVLLKAEKVRVIGNHTAFKTDKSPFGLSEEFTAGFKEKLEMLNTDSTPLLADLTKTEQEVVKHIIRIAVAADEIDMIASPHSFMRKLAVERARDIPLWTHDHKAAHARVFGHLGVLESAHDDFNLGRALWEVRNLGKLLKDTELGKSEFFQRYVGLLQLQSLEEHQHIGIVTMRGVREEIEKLFTEIGEQEIKAQHDKTIRDSTWKNNGDGLHAAYAINVGMIERQVHRTVNSLRHKPGGPYDKTDINDFIQICNELRTEVINGNPSLKDDDLDLIGFNKNGVPLPYSTYYRLQPVPIRNQVA